MVLGGDAADGVGMSLDPRDLEMDAVLGALYDSDQERYAGLGASSPRVARWLGDIRTYFPTSVVRVMQQDALERLNLRRMLLEPELLADVEPDVNLVATLISLGSVIPAGTRATARAVVRRVVDDLERRLANPMCQAVHGSLSRTTRRHRPRPREIDWDRTIRANLRHWRPELGTVIPERLVGSGRRQRAARDIILAVDQSGSMATSVVYAAVFGAVLASLRSISTRLVVFDTSVVDLTEHIDDPIDLLFGVQLGGGTDIGRALSYCQQLVTRPLDTIVILISDLFEGGSRDRLTRRAAALIGSGVQVVALLALTDRGRPAYDHDMAATLNGLGVPAFSCTPDLFPELMAAALSRHDLNQWAAAHELV